MTPDVPRDRIQTFNYVSSTFGFGRGVCRLVATLMFDLKLIDAHHIPTTGGVLIIGNHQSYIDPPLYACKLRRPASFLAKSELFSNPYFGGLIRGLNAFPVRQGEGDVGAVRETIRRLQEGHLLTMFPEGGRSNSPEIEPFQGGVGLIVRRAGPTVKVVPAAIHGPFEAWSRHRKFPRAHPCRIKYGKPLSLSDLKAAQIVQILETQVRGLYEELRSDAK